MANETKSSPADHYFEPTGSNANAENIGHVLNDLTDIVASGDPREGVDTVKWNGVQFILGEGGGGIDADAYQALMGNGQGGARGASAGKASYIEDGRPRPDLGFPGFYYNGVNFGYQLALPNNVVGAPAQKLTSNPTLIMQDDPTYPGRKIEIPHHQLTLGDVANVDFSGNSLVGISGQDVRFTMHDGAKMDLTGGVKGGTTGPQVYVHGGQEIYIDDTYKVVNAANKATITCVVALYYRERGEHISRLDSYIGPKYGAFMTEKVSPGPGLQPIMNYEDIEAFYGQFCGYAYFNIEEESIVINKTYIPVVPEAERENWDIETYPAEKYAFITEVGMAFVYSYVFKGTYSDTCYTDDKYDTGNEGVILQRLMSNSSYEQTLLASGNVYAEYKSSSWSTTTTKKEVTASTYLGNSNFKITFPFKLIYQEKVGETVPSWTLLRSGYNKISSVFGSAKVYITENPTVTIRGASYFDLTGNPHFTMQGNSTFITEASSNFRCKDYADIDFQNTSIMKIGTSIINIAGGAIINIEGTDGYNSNTCADNLTKGTKASLGHKWTTSHYYPEIQIKNGVRIEMSNSPVVKISDISTTHIAGSSHLLMKDMSTLALSGQSKVIMQGSGALGSPALFCDPDGIRLVGQMGSGDWNATNITNSWYTDYRQRISQNIDSPTLWMEKNTAIVANGKGPSYFYMQSNDPGSPTSMWLMGGAFVQYTGNAHEEMHDGSILIMRGSKPSIDDKTKEPIPFWTDGTNGGYRINQGKLATDDYQHQNTSWIRGNMPQAGAPLIDLYDRSIMTLRGYWQTEGTESGSVEYRFPDDPNDEFLYDENGALRCPGNNNIDKDNILDKLKAVDASLWKKFKINTDTLEIDVDGMKATKTTVASKPYVVWKFNIEYALDISQYRTKNEGSPLVEIIENAEIRQHGNTKFILVENNTVIDGEEYLAGLTIKIRNESAHFSMEKLKELAGN